MILSDPVTLPFDRDSFVRLLRWGATPGTSPYSHKQIAEWCDRFWRQYMDVDAEPAIEALLPLLADVDTQWELYLANTFSLEQLRTQEFESVYMPVQWFHDWLADALQR